MGRRGKMSVGTIPARAMPYKDPERERAWHAAHAAEARTRASKWHQAHREEHKMRCRTYQTANRERCRTNNRNWVAANPEKSIIHRTRSRAKKNGIEFDLLPQDITIPATCPVLGIPLTRSGKQDDNAPSLDRIDNAKGYVRGNVVIVSWRANRLKSDATIAELRQIASFYGQLQ